MFNKRVVGVFALLVGVLFILNFVSAGFDWSMQLEDISFKQVCGRNCPSMGVFS